MTRYDTATRLIQETPFRFRIDQGEHMPVPGIVFASGDLLPEEQALRQVVNVAMLPGVVRASYAMPDIHWGYGFPIGGVAATDIAAGGVVSPGGVGFDISCGVRLLTVALQRDQLATTLNRLMDELDRTTPRGIGQGGLWRLSEGQLEGVLYGGAGYAVQHGHGLPRDLDRCEDFGAVADADPAQVSPRAVERGLAQVGSLGSGNHFLEVQAVEKIYDPAVAAAFGLRLGQVCVMIHCGSRGLGHQICTDHVRVMEKAMPGYGISVPDRQLACAPVESREGRAYLGAMAAAANYGRANRQLLTEATRTAFRHVTGATVDLVYDVSHNLAKIEVHEGMRLCVHRKGATRALPPHHPDLPADLAPYGQPVLIPGTMGTASHVLTGVTGADAFHSTCHGAGRTHSRHQAARSTDGRRLRDRLEAQGIAVRGSSWRGLAEEAPTAYKDVDAVVAAGVGAGLCRRVARLVPLGVVKG
ncbi:RtcB family protein [Streptosporangium sp. CA-115845]|uniref:RtcB family protein n=1 Tax=Streptosporangium sp. CA-115845 TaxID=3240071 RepID=UPI003D90BADA